VKRHIRIIKSNPPRRYCTKVLPVRLVIPCCDWGSTVVSYIAAFNRLNNLKD
jgi:hypothetical protein